MLRSPAKAPPESIDDLLSSRLAAKLSQFDFASRKVFAGKLKGERRSKKRGQSVEFADHRPYVSGDDLRHIDWNIFGRLDRLFLKLFLEEEDLSLHLVIDATESMACGEPEKFAFAREAAAALGYIGLANLNRVSVTAIGLTTPAESAQPPQPVTPLTNLRGRRRIHDLGVWLCALDPSGAVSFTEAAKRIALARRGRGVMVIISDFLFKEGYEQGLRYLVGRGYDLVLIQVLSPQEIEPTLGGDLRLRDVEDGDLTEITVSAPLLKRYKANLAAWCDQLRLFCARREIALITLPSDTPMDTLILGYLRDRGILR